MKRLILTIFLPLSLLGMEGEERSSSEEALASSSSPSHTVSISAIEEDLEEEISMEELSRQALSIFFEDEAGSLHAHQFSLELSRRMHSQVVERNGNLRKLMRQRTLYDSQDRADTPDLSLRKELRDIVIPTLTELFEEKEEAHHRDRKKLTTERLKFRLALLTAATTLLTTTAATVTAIIVALNT